MNLAEMVDELENHLLEANQALIAEAADNQYADVIGTTIAVLAVHKKHAIVMWVGDSRIYRFRNNILEQLTVDHSLVQEMIDETNLRIVDVENHPATNVITRAIGIEEELFLELDHMEVQNGDRFVLCSDGLFKDIDERHIAELLKIQDIHRCNEALKKAALDAGGNDNITSVLVDFKNANTE